MNSETDLCCRTKNRNGFSFSPVVSAVLVAASLGTSGSSQAQSVQTGHWDTRFSAPTVATVEKFSIDDSDRLFVIGNFEAFSGVVSEDIVVWDGEDWSGIPGGYPILGIDLNGNVYATRTTGKYNEVDLIRWDGSDWSLVYRSSHPYIRLAARRDESIVLSTCTPPCGSFCPHWTRTPLHLFRDGEIRDITSGEDCGNDLFRTRDDVVHNVIDGNTMQWDDDLGWAFEAGPIPLDWYATGRTIANDGTPYAAIAKWLESPRLQRWSDSTWQTIDLPEPADEIRMVAGNANEIYVALKTDITSAVYSFDGQQWTQIGGLLIGTVNTLAVDSENVLYVGGSFREPETGARNLVRWANASWETIVVVGRGSTTSAGVYSSDDEKIFAQGSFPDPGFWEWDGDGFTLVTNASRINDVKGSPITPDDFGVDNWSDLDLPDCPEGGQYKYVNRVAGHPGDPKLYAVVYCMIDYGGPSDLRHEALLMEWDSQDWRIFGRFAVPAVRYAVNIQSLHLHSSGDLYVTGEFTEVNGEEMSGIARWDGTTWNALGSGLVSPNKPSGFARTMKEFDGKLVVAGPFLKAGELDVGYVAAWNGTSWERFGHFNGEVFIMAKHPQLGLYAAGRFQFSDTRSTNNVARWDGQAWDGLGTGIVGLEVRSIAFEDTTAVWFGGKFYDAGGAPSQNIARWIPGAGGEPNGPDEPDEPGDPNLQSYPNPTTGTFTVSFSSVRSGDAIVELFDLTGKRVATLFAGEVAADELQLIPASLTGLAAGIYLLAARLPDGHASRKVVYLGRPD